MTPWTGESTVIPPVTVTAAGVAYVDPVQDALARDLDGALWALCEGTAAGKPEYANPLHPERQREAMDGFLCACCKKPAARNQDGMLWVLPLLNRAADTRWEGITCGIPPMCESCGESAPRYCPRLREGHVTLRVKEAELIGMRGTLYPRPGAPGIPQPDTLVRYGSPDLPFVVAHEAVRELCEITVVGFGTAIP
ncbi:hypothetical protein ACIP2Z_38900 [Streptomyces iakyrus]|uniref:Uncharacterized protein n=1 Tax=Streptomyces iakyrus TaxID=68219 RepID=A0ABW8FS25_9ACTN